MAVDFLAESEFEVLLSRLVLGIEELVSLGDLVLECLGVGLCDSETHVDKVPHFVDCCLLVSHISLIL